MYMYICTIWKQVQSVLWNMLVDAQALLVMDQKPEWWYDSHGNNQPQRGIQTQRLHTKNRRTDRAAKTKKSSCSH